jgi:hypothetical protein
MCMQLGLNNLFGLRCLVRDFVVRLSQQPLRPPVPCPRDPWQHGRRHLSTLAHREMMKPKDHGENTHDGTPSNLTLFMCPLVTSAKRAFASASQASLLKKKERRDPGTSCPLQIHHRVLCPAWDGHTSRLQQGNPKPEQ